MIDEYVFNTDKMSLVSEMNSREQKYYADRDLETEKDIDTSKRDIELLKDRLGKEQTVRRQLQEYDALAAVIQRYPARNDTIKETATVKSELESTLKEKNELGHLVGRKTMLQ